MYGVDKKVAIDRLRGTRTVPTGDCRVKICRFDVLKSLGATEANKTDLITDSK